VSGPEQHGLDLRLQPAHLGLGAKVLVQPELTGMDWYEAYAARTEGDGAEGRLVALHDFHEDWTSWEMHPAGDELVLCVTGEIEVIQERPEGTRVCIALACARGGQRHVRDPGTGHAAPLAR